MCRFVYRRHADDIYALVNIDRFMTTTSCFGQEQAHNTIAVTPTCTRACLRRPFAPRNLTTNCFSRNFVFGTRGTQITGSGSFQLSIVQHDLYTAYLVVCQRGGSFSGDVTLTYLNPVPEGSLSQHLPIQLAMLPALYTVSSVFRRLCRLFGIFCV